METIWIKEIETDKVNYNQAPHKVHLHSYLVNKSKEFVYAYRNTNTKQVTYFSKRLPFSTTRRKFIEVRNPSWAK